MQRRTHQRTRLNPRKRPGGAIVMSALLTAGGLVAAGTAGGYSLTSGHAHEAQPAPALATTPFTRGIVTALKDPAGLVAAMTKALETNATLDEKDPTRTVREFHKDTPFDLVALTWKGNKNLSAFVRAMDKDGSWGPWFVAKQLTSRTAHTKGTQLVYVKPTTTIQVATAPTRDTTSLTTADPGVSPAAHAAPPSKSARTSAPAGAALSSVPAIATDHTRQDAPAIDPSVSSVPALGQPGKHTPFGSVPAATPVAAHATGSQAADATGSSELADSMTVFFGNSTPAPGESDTIQLTAGAADWRGIPQPIVKRSAWFKGLSAPAGCSAPTIDDKITAITINQALNGSNDYQPNQVPHMLQEYYRYATRPTDDNNGLGLCDIPFNAIVDNNGAIWEGRAGGLNKAVRGAATPGFNENTWSIGALGNFTTQPLTDSMINGIGKLAGWRAAVAGISPTGGSTHTSEGNNKYPKGTPVWVPTIENGLTLTGNQPSNTIGQAMGRIRDIATKHYNDIKAGTFDAQADAEVNKARKQAAEQEQRHDTTPVDNDAQKAISTLLGPQAHDLSGLADGSSLVNSLDSVLGKDSSGAVVKVAGSLLALAVAAAITHGGLGAKISEIANTPIAGSLTLADVPVMVTKVIDLSGDTKYARVWHSLSAVAGPALGKVIGGEHTAVTVGAHTTEIHWVPFEHGLIVDSPDSGTHAIWGAIGDAWAKQGFNAGPLGMPVGEEHPVNDHELRTDFQGGFITFDKTTGATTIHTGDKVIPVPAPAPRR